MEVTRKRSGFIAESYVEIREDRVSRLAEVRQSSVFLLSVKVLKCVERDPCQPIGPTCGPFAAEGFHLDPEVSSFSAKPVDFCSDLGRNGRKFKAD